jgi:hypothetical protein
LISKYSLIFSSNTEKEEYARKIARRLRKKSENLPGSRLDDFK